MRLERSFHSKLKAVYDHIVQGAVQKARRMFDAFWAGTRCVWRGMAARLYQRWTPPTGCSVDDVEQELAVAAWKYLCENKYDATKGRTLADYIIFNACNLAKYWLHQQRGAILHGNRDKHPTRAPQTFDPVPKRDEESAAYAMLTRMRTSAEQEGSVGRKQHLTSLLDQHQLRTHYDMRDRFILAALVYHDGNAERAANYLYGDAELRLWCRFGDEQHALATVRRAARTYAQPVPVEVLDTDDFDWVAPAERDDFDWVV